MASKIPFLAAIAAVVALPSMAMAHPKLLSATPAANATVAATAKLELKFSERLMPKLSGATLTMTGMAGMTHAPMPVKDVQGTIGADGKSLVLTAPKPLMAGTYRVDWHVVSSDTHRIAGAYSFTIR
jgi:methionine-rich copper-binding protein CopC